MQPLAGDGYTAAAVRDALVRHRRFTFDYELLSKENIHLGWLGEVRAATVAYNALAELKRTAQLTVDDSAHIDWLNDRVRPWVSLRMPDGGLRAWPQGVLLLSTPPRRTDGVTVTREVECYDQLLVLREDRLDTRYTILAGAAYTDEVRLLLESAGIVDHAIDPSDETLPVDREWPVGSSKLQIVNDLLGAIGHETLWFNEVGAARARPYRSPTDLASEYTYRDDAESVQLVEAEDTLDLFGIANKWVLVVSEPDRDPLVAARTNDNPSSPTSTVNRGRTITDFREVDAASADALASLADRIAYEASQVYTAVEFETGLMPFHSHADVLTYANATLGISAKYSQHRWEMPLAAGGRMQHRVRRVVTI